MSFTFEQLLHDRVTLCEQLSSAEQAQLESWYADLERQESQTLFGQPIPPAFQSVDQGKIDQVQRQIDNLLAQLSITTVRLREVSDENKRLRSEIAILRAKVVQHIVLVEYNKDMSVHNAGR